MAKKKVLAVVKLQIRAGQATPAPPVGTALGQHGVNIMEFCRQYNEQTQQQAGQVIPAELTIYEDRSFTFITKQPPAAELIKQAAGDREGLGRAEPREGRQRHPGAAPADRRAEDGRPQRERRRGGDEDHRRDGAQHGCRGGGRMSAQGQALPQARRARRPRARVLAGRGDQGPQGASRTRSSTRPSRSRSGWASTRARPTSSSAARSRCRTARAGRSAWPCSPRVAKATEAKEAGADVVGGEELVEQVMERDHRLRRRGRDAGHDGRGRQGRSRARAAGPDAEPEDRHGDQRHRQGRRGHQGRQGRVRDRPDRATST